MEIDEIVEVVREAHGDVEYRADPEALEYNESLSMNDEDVAFTSSRIDPEMLAED